MIEMRESAICNFHSKWWQVLVLALILYVAKSGLV